MNLLFTFAVGLPTTSIQIYLKLTEFFNVIKLGNKIDFTRLIQTVHEEKVFFKRILLPFNSFLVEKIPIILVALVKS